MANKPDDTKEIPVLIPQEIPVPEFIAQLEKANVTAEMLIALAEGSKAPSDEAIADIDGLARRVARIEDAMTSLGDMWKRLAAIEAHFMGKISP